MLYMGNSNNNKNKRQQSFLNPSTSSFYNKHRRRRQLHSTSSAGQLNNPKLKLSRDYKAQRFYSQTRNKKWSAIRQFHRMKLPPRRGGKPPQWEKEGDILYQTMQDYDDDDSTDNAFDTTITWNSNKQQQQKQKFILPHIITSYLHSKVPITYNQAKQLALQYLHPKSVVITAPVKKYYNNNNNNNNNDDDDEIVVAFNDTEPTWSWGGLSVGPVWKQKLIQARFFQPTPIQKQAFSAITSPSSSSSPDGGGNVILASPTGSGKSLAYLLPLVLTTPMIKGTTTGATTISSSSTEINNDNNSSSSNNHNNNHRSNNKKVVTLPSGYTFPPIHKGMGRVWIMTPSQELAWQLHRLVVYTLDQGNRGPYQYPLHSHHFNSSHPQRVHVLEEPPAKHLPKSEQRHQQLTSVLKSQSCIIVGTVPAFHQLWRDMLECAKVDYLGLGEHTERLFQNLQTIVLDEADRLLMLDQPTSSSSSSTELHTWELLESILSKKKLERQQILNKQHQQAQTASSEPNIVRSWAPRNHIRLHHHKAHSAPHVLAASSSKSTSSVTPKLRFICASATVGRNLRRQIMALTQSPSMDKTAKLITADARTKKHENVRKASLLPTTLEHWYRLIDNFKSKSKKEQKHYDEVNAKWIVSKLVETLHQLEDPLPTLIFPGSKIGVDTVKRLLKKTHEFEFVGGIEEAHYLTQNRNEVDAILNKNANLSDSWKTTPILVVEEHLGRGLDISNLGYVIMLQVPSSVGEYAHLAGRTGRNGKLGKAISICCPEDVPKLAAVAEILDLGFQNIMPDEMK